MKLSQLFMRTKTPRVIGRLLTVDLPQFGIEAVVAKVDTGAFSGALHATQIREVKQRGVHRLEFMPLGKGPLVRTENFHKKRVKSSNGTAMVRYAIDTEVLIFGRIVPITITLANRRAMRYKIIIGRKFLSTHGFLIDVTSNNQ